MEVTLFIWSYCWDIKKIITKSGISLNVGTLNRGFTVICHLPTASTYAFYHN
jgi:hypothetical protein